MISCNLLLTRGHFITGVYMSRKENPLRQLPINLEERGSIRIKLDDIIQKKGISLNQLSFRTEMQRTQLRNYRDNKIQRLDIDILIRLCYVLECDLTDIIEYTPYNKNDA